MTWCRRNPLGGWGLRCSSFPLIVADVPCIASSSLLDLHTQAPSERPYLLLGQAPFNQTELSGIHPDFLAKAVDLGVDFTSNEQEEAGEV